MTDLNSVLPDFATCPFSHLLPSLDKSLITTADLVSLDAVDVAKRAQLPPAEVTKLARVVVEALQNNLGVYDASYGANVSVINGEGHNERSSNETTRDWSVISTLDESLDAALGGGLPLGYLTEVTGERYTSSMG